MVIFLLATYRHPHDQCLLGRGMAKPRSATLKTNVTPTQAIRALRELCGSAGWEWKREEGSRVVDRMMIIMPIARVTKTFRIIVTSGTAEGLSLTAWEEVSGSSGGITQTEWIVPGHLTGGPFNHLLAAWCARHPNCPWRWSFGQRSVIGFLLPVWRRSRRQFSKFSINTSRSAWPPTVEWPPKAWPDSREEE